MNKIICDVCGTDYPETAAQCPICGCASAGAKTAARNETADVEEQAAYSYVKGGRYSKANVRKRLKENQIPYAPSELEPEYDDEEQGIEEEEEGGSNRGLVIVIAILLLAIVAVSTYIAISIFGVGVNKNSGTDKNPTINQPIVTTAPTTEPTTESTGVACTDLELSDVDIYLNTIGSTWQLTATPVPENTTDTVYFGSSDENVVTVDENGRVTAVGTGEASILVICGDVVVECPVLCGEKEDETTEPTDPTEETEPTETPDDFVLKLKSKDFTLSKAGATYKLYDGEVDASDITWTSDDEDVATIKDGVVTAVGKGRTRVYGEYEDQKVSCWVSCNLPEEEVTEPDDTTQTEDPTEPDVTEPEEDHTYAIRINGKKPNYGTEQAAEATIAVGDELNIKIVDENGKRVEVEWTASKSGIVSVGSNSVTGEKAGTVTLTAEIDGQKLTCKFIVK